MRVLHLISSGGYYGAENVIVNLAASLERLGHHSTLGVFYNVHRPNGDLGEVATALGLPFETIVCKGRASWEAIRTLRQIVKRHEINIVHAHGYKADAYALLALSSHVPLISTCHNWPTTTIPLRIYQRMDMFCLRYFDKAVAVSANVAAILQHSGIPEEKIATIPNGVNVSLFGSARPTVAQQFRRCNGLIIGTVGRLAPEKGQEYLLRAAPEILSRFPDTVFLFAGDGPARRELEDVARQLGINKSVHFLGRRLDMPAVYASMDVFVLPSLEEGMPMAILEALASKKPVVATPVGDIPQLIHHDQTGILVRPKEVPDLQDAILRLIGDSDLRARLGNDGGDWVENHFSADTMARRYSELYSSLAEKHWSPARYSTRSLREETRVKGV